MKIRCNGYPDQEGFIDQEDSWTVIANPVSGTKYEWREGTTGSGSSLGTQKNVRVIGALTYITWAVTQPTPLEVHITTDGQARLASQTNPVSGTPYAPYQDLNSANYNMSTSYATLRGFLVEAYKVKLEVEVTWATTQPTNLTLKVPWQKKRG